MENEVAGLVQEYFQLPVVSPATDEALLQQLLSERINYLIQSDFNHLVFLLYRVDVDEQKLKGILKDNPDIQAGFMIAGLVIERLEQKAISKKRYSNQAPKDIDGEERW